MQEQKTRESHRTLSFEQGRQKDNTKEPADGLSASQFRVIEP